MTLLSQDLCKESRRRDGAFKQSVPAFVSPNLLSISKKTRLRWTYSCMRSSENMSNVVTSNVWLADDGVM